MISDLCKLIKLAFTPVGDHSAIVSDVRAERRVNRTDALLGQGSALSDKFETLVGEYCHGVSVSTNGQRLVC